jgi:hypothetical protein
MKKKIIMAIVLSLFAFNFNCLAQKVVNVFLPDPCTFTSIQKIPQKGQLDFQIFPNPNNGKFELKLKNPAADFLNVNIYILDLMGKIVYENNCTLRNGAYEFNAINITSGIYYIRLQNEKKSAVKMFIVQ